MLGCTLSRTVDFQLRVCCMNTSSFSHWTKWSVNRVVTPVTVNSHYKLCCNEMNYTRNAYPTSKEREQNRQTCLPSTIPRSHPFKGPSCFKTLLRSKGRHLFTSWNMLLPRLVVHSSASSIIWFIWPLSVGCGISVVRVTYPIPLVSSEKRHSGK